MSLLKRIFLPKEETIKTYADFWNWFQKNEKSFYKTVKENGNIEKDFFNKLSPKLNELKEGIFYLTGMYDDNTVELILTPDGIIKNIVFVEELVKAAPETKCWKFTALKPELDIENVNINMADYLFSKENIWFYSNEIPGYPDEVDITIVHNDYNENNKSAITNGVYIFLDNYLGELNFATMIDSLKIIGKNMAEKELIPVEKLKNFLIWRHKEFVEKYEDTIHNIGNDNYSLLEAELESGNVLIAVVNTDLLSWENKASHPWIAEVEIKYNGKNNNGMPDKKTSELLLKIEDEIQENLKDFEGYLNIGRQTAKSTRAIYFACKDFRKPAKVLDKVQHYYADQVEILYDIYKDKYWQSFNRFSNN